MQEEIQLKSYSKKGHGQCDTFEVKGAFADEKVLIEPTKQKKRGKRAGILKQILEPSQKRVKPRCKHANECGGCCWQGLEYEHQLEIKQGVIQELFGDLGQVDPICPGPQYSYRAKMQFSFSQDLAKNKYLGLMQKEGKGRVLNLEMCSISESWFAETLLKARGWFESSELEAFHPRKNTGSLRELTLRKGYNTDSKMVILTVAGSLVPSKQELKRFVEALEVDENTAVFLLIHSAIKGQKTEFFEIHLAGPKTLREKLHVQGHTFDFKISPQAFFQPNVAMAEKMITKIIQTLPQERDSIVDLCCGIATIGICLTPYAKSVRGEEIMPESVCDARENLKLNAIENMQVFRNDMKDLSFTTKPDCIVLDPPREGLHPKTLKALIENPIKQISYLSCNPYTQVEDVRELVTGGYKVKQICPFDQFAHTPHVENLVILEHNT